MDAGVELFAKEKPFIFIRGNHETRGTGARTIMSYFLHSSGRNYYAFTQGGVRFVVLFYIPVITDSDWHGATDLTDKWGPVLNSAKIDLVISGHTHEFERIMPAVGVNNFPILITERKMILETKVTEDQLECRVIDTNGELAGSFNNEAFTFFPE